MSAMRASKIAMAQIQPSPSPNLLQSEISQDVQPAIREPDEYRHESLPASTWRICARNVASLCPMAYARQPQIGTVQRQRQPQKSHRPRGIVHAYDRHMCRLARRDSMRTGGARLSVRGAASAVSGMVREGDFQPLAITRCGAASFCEVHKASARQSL